MLRIIAFVALLAITSGASHSLSAQTSPPALPEPRPAEPEITTLATTYANAIVERDVATLDRLLADDFVDVSPAGTVSTRAQLRVYGDTVVITGRDTRRGTAGGRAFTGVLVTTLVALHGDGQWRIAASYSSSVPPAQGAPVPLK